MALVGDSFYAAPRNQDSMLRFTPRDTDSARNFARYTVPLGTLEIHGPGVLTPTKCTLGLTCEITLPGQGLAASNRVRLYEASARTWSRRA